MCECVCVSKKTCFVHLTPSTIPTTHLHTITAPPNLGEPRRTFFHGTVGRSVTLNLTILDAKPLVQPANVSWMFNDIPIFIDGNKYTQDVTPDGRLATLTIRDLNLLDSGSYRANVRHISSDVPQSRMMQLTVKSEYSNIG